MLRNHPEIFALSAICLALFANIGLQRAIQEVERETFRVRQLVVDSDRLPQRIEPIREGILVIREVLRACPKP